VVAEVWILETKKEVAIRARKELGPELSWGLSHLADATLPSVEAFFFQKWNKDTFKVGARRTGPSNVLPLHHWVEITQRKTSP